MVAGATFLNGELLTQLATCGGIPKTAVLVENPFKQGQKAIATNPVPKTSVNAVIYGCKWLTALAVEQ
jgi:hypothetical protein